MLSTTTHLTTDIVAMPLLWALPLGLYLLSFVVAFADRRGAARIITLAAPFIILMAGGLAFAEGSHRPIFSATVGLVLLFVMAVTLHTELYRLRPAPDRLTSFYLIMSLGGVIGGAICAIVAPSLFDWAYEHPLLILAGALLLPQRSYVKSIEQVWADPSWRPYLTRWLPIAAIALSLAGDRRFIPDLPEWMAIAVPILIGIIAMFAIGRRFVFAACLAALMMSYGGWWALKLSWHDVRTRSYFGIYTVSTRNGGTVRSLAHGTTLHGLQLLSPGREKDLTSYYTSNSGIGRSMAAVGTLYGPAARVGVVGLGTGTLACYRQPGQRWTFFEIDPAMVRVAQTKFSFLSRCAPDARIVLGDARLALVRAPERLFDVLVVDAFSSDAVPMHLLTEEALDVYGRSLRPDGLLIMHISNRYLDLEPVIANGAHRKGWKAMMLNHSPDAATVLSLHGTPSVWVAMSRDPRKLDQMIMAGTSPAMWWRLEPRRNFAGWTDDYASILPLIEGVDFW
jgi:spermidine synthase